MRVMIPALRRSLDETDESFRRSAARQLGVDIGEMGEVQILRQAVDARKKSDVFFSVHALVDLSPRAARRVLGDTRRHAQLWQEPERTILSLTNFSCDERAAYKVKTSLPLEKAQCLSDSGKLRPLRFRDGMLHERLKPFRPLIIFLDHH